MGEAAHKFQYSIEEYIEMEENSLEKLEYHEGEIYSMAGGTLNHGLLSNNIGGTLRDVIRAKGKSCRTYSSDAKIAISNKKFVYSDTFVVCGKTESFPQMLQAAKNPILIVEVLSDSTARYDREDKFQAYQNIESFKEYVLISQDKVLVEVFFKPEDVYFWQYRAYRNLDEIIKLQSIDVEVSLSEIYLNWEFQEK